jgi:hypothetical protein
VTGLKKPASEIKRAVKRSKIIPETKKVTASKKSRNKWFWTLSQDFLKRLETGEKKLFEVEDGVVRGFRVGVKGRFWSMN